MCCPALYRRLQRDHTWETDGEELHQFLEDGLAKHLKVQVGGIVATTAIQSAGGCGQRSAGWVLLGSLAWHSRRRRLLLPPLLGAVGR